jgi:hypothetical protein
MRLFLYLFLFFYAGVSMAQETLKSADEYFRKQDYEKALQHLQIILTNPDQLKGDERSFAYMLKAKTHLNLIDRAVKNNDIKSTEKYKDAYFLAYQDLLDARKFVLGESAKKECEALGNYLNRIIKNLGAAILNKIYSDNAMQAAAKNAALDEAQKYMMASIGLNAADYSAYDLYGQVMMLKKSDDDALLYFEKSIKYFEGIKNAPADFAHFRVYGNIAIIQLNGQKSTAALNIIQNGKSSLEKHFQTITKKDSLSKKEYSEMKTLLDNIENDIYLNSPDLAQKAIEKFKSQCNENPADFMARFSLAQIYEQQKMTTEAAAEYESVLKMDSTNRLAAFNLGALYLNEALELEVKIVQDEKLKFKFSNLLLRSEALLKKALGPEEKDIDCIDALLKIYGRLQKKEEYLYYRNLKTALLQSK